MTRRKLNKLFEEWNEKSKDNPEACDDYFYAGGESFKDFLEERLTIVGRVARLFRSADDA